MDFIIKHYIAYDGSVAYARNIEFNKLNGINWLMEPEKYKAQKISLKHARKAIKFNSKLKHTSAYNCKIEIINV